MNPLCPSAGRGSCSEPESSKNSPLDIACTFPVYLTAFVALSLSSSLLPSHTPLILLRLSLFVDNAASYISPLQRKATAETKPG